ncbi:hypothetical protein VRK_17300 [Vibrio sp. MEBiC08052]|nr:hypothetical protein VRK_17300 [Vibrio sp. MEBiC08052]
MVIFRHICRSDFTFSIVRREIGSHSNTNNNQISAYMRA